MLPRAFLFGALLCAAAAHGADWPCYRGPTRDGIVAEKGLLIDWPAEGPKKLWQAPVGDGGKGTHGGAVVSGGKVFVPGRAGEKDIVACFDAQSGKELWKFEIDAPGRVAGGYGNGPRATPSVSGGFVYALGAFGYLVCLDAEKGAKVWEHRLLEEYSSVSPKFGVAAAPLVEGDLVICEPGGKDAALVAFDARTGKEAWRAGSDAPSYAPPMAVTITGVRQVLGFHATGLVSRDPGSGKELWRIRYDDAKNIAAPIVNGDTLYLSNSGYGISAFTLRLASGQWQTEKKWTNATDKAHSSPAVLTESGLCFYDWTGEGGALKCLDPKDGKLCWSVPFKGKENAMLMLLDARSLLANFDDGEIKLYEISAQACREKSAFKVLV